MNLPAPVPSPCISVCRMEAGLCAGCLRTLEEIAAWSRLDDEAKRAVWALLPARQQRLKPVLAEGEGPAA